MDEQEQERPRKAYQSLPQRSTASPNWRLKDDAPRAEPQTRTRNGPAPDGNRSQQNGSSDGNSGTRLYVGNLLYSAQRDDVSDFFIQNGFKVVNLSMSIDPMTGRNPSYCFVDFETAEDASRAMADLNGQEVLGRPVRINPGVAKKSGDNPGLRTNSYNRGWQRQDSGNAPADRGYKPTFDRWSRNDAPSHWNEPQSQSKRLYVGNLPRMEPQSAVDSAMQQLFSGFELTAVSKIISPHESKKSEPGDHYYLFVDMANAEDMDAAIETLDGSQTPWGGTVKVNRARENRDRKVNREQPGFPRRPVGEGRQPAEWRGRTEDAQ